MIDIRLVRDQPRKSRPALGRRGVPPETIERLLAFDTSARSASGRRDDLRAQVKDLSRQVADARRGGDNQMAERLTAQSRDLGELERVADGEAATASDEVRAHPARAAEPSFRRGS